MNYYIISCSKCRSILAIDPWQKQHIMNNGDINKVIKVNEDHLIEWIKKNPSKYIKIGNGAFNATRVKISEEFYLRLRLELPAQYFDNTTNFLKFK